MPDDSAASADDSALPHLTSWRPDWDFGPLDEYPVYTRANIGEVMPGVISPLSSTAGATVLDAGFIMLGKVLVGWEVMKQYLPESVQRGEQAGCVGVFYGRLALNLSLMIAGADLVPGTSAQAVEEQYLGKARHPGAPRRKLTREEQRVRLTVGPNYLRFLARAPRLARQQAALVDRYERREAARELTTLGDQTLLSLLAFNRRVQVPVAMLHLFNSVAASTGLETLSRTVRAWLPDGPAGLTEQLVTGLADVESARPAYAIWDLSRQVLRTTRLGPLFEQTPARKLAAALAALPGAEADRFRAAMRVFLDRFGYRAMREADLASLRWAEDPTFVYTTIKGYLAAGDEADPYAAQRRQRRVRQEAEVFALARLSRTRRLPFRMLLRLARTYVSLREETKAQWVRVMGPGRTAYREVGRRLIVRKLIDAPADLYLLNERELRQALQGEAGGDALRAAIARRRRDMALCERIEIPELFEGVPAAGWSGAPTATPGAEAGEPLLRGIAVSPGRVRGRARVITELDDEAAVAPGEILVAPYTDAAWTPLFFTAAAVVVDLGGPLSHGSTVAREYGLPAVVNVKVGTRRIRDGQEITVDGGRGEVILHD
jgi:pyruvate,water dikinase